MSKSEKTLEEQLVALQEKKEKAHRQIVKQKLADNARFQAMVDVYRKTKRYHTEATNLTDDDKYEAQRAQIQDRLTALETKRATAIEARDNLQASLDAHEAAQNKLAEQLISILDNGEVPTDFDAKVESILDSIGVDTLTEEPEDPFITYRRAKKDE